MSEPSKLLRFGVFELNLETEELRKSGALIKLPRQPFKILALLAGQPGRLVSREEIQRQIWGGETFVDFEQGMNHCIKQIRTALGDSAETPRYVETLPRRGYRFIAPVKAKTVASDSSLLEDSGTFKGGIPAAAMSTVARDSASPDLSGAGRQKPPLQGMGALQGDVAADARTGVEHAPATAAPATVPEVVPIGEPHPRIRQARLTRLEAALAIVTLIVGGVGYYLLRTRKSSETQKDQAAGVGLGSVRQRRSVAVLGFQNLSGRADAAWLSTAVSEMLATELAAGEELRIIPGENVARMKVEAHLADEDSLARDTLARVRKILGADYVVLGSYTDLGKEAGGQIRLDVRLQDAAAGEIILSLAEAGTEADLFELVSRAGARMRPRLGVGAVPAAEAGSVRAALPSNRQAARLYSQGLEKLRVFDTLAARDFLEKAVAAEPDYALAHSAMAEAWTKLGYDGKAREEAKTAFDLSANLAREDRLSVEARYREMTSQWDQAIRLYQTLWRGSPDNLEYGLRLASMQTSASKGKQALATVEKLRTLPPPGREDPRIDLEEADAAGSLGDYGLEQAAARRAANKGEAQGSALVVARARSKQAKALFYKGDLAGALSIYRQALATYRRSGDKREVASSLNNIAGVLVEQGNLAEAQKTYQQALIIYREIGNKRQAAGTLSNMGAVFQQQGGLAEADGMYQQALAMDRESGNKSGEATDLNNMAEVRYGQADLAGARKMHEQALAMDRESGDRLTMAEALFDLGEVLVAQGDLDGARKRHKEALAIRNELGVMGSAAESGLALAELSLEEGHPAEGEAPARKAAEEFRAEKLAGNEAHARAVLARSQLAQGRITEAAKTINGATTLAVRSQNSSLRLSVAITEARIRAASRRQLAQAEAKDSLRRTLQEAARLGLVGLQLEAGLALGEVEVESGDSASGRARLVSVQEQAAAKGFGLIARKAAAARG